MSSPSYLPDYSMNGRPQQPPLSPNMLALGKDPNFTGPFAQALRDRIKPGQTSPLDQLRNNLEIQNASAARMGQLEGIQQGAAQAAAQPPQPSQAELLAQMGLTGTSKPQRQNRYGSLFEAMGLKPFVVA